MISNSLLKKGFKYTFFAGIPATTLLDYNKLIDLESFLYPINKSLSGQIRSNRAAITGALIFFDYKLTGINSDTHQRSANRLLHLCRLNKGTYVKIGQHVGALDMLLPKEYVKTMKCLHSDAPHSSFEEVISVLKEDLKCQSDDELLSKYFSKIDEEPIGSASLAQVHTAVLAHSGQKVAVKVQHRKVFESALRDVEIMDFGFLLADKIFPEFKLQWLINLTKANLFKELDFRIECENTKKAKRLYCDGKGPKSWGADWLTIPDVYDEFTTKRILVMDFAKGIHVNTLPDQKWANQKILNEVIQKMQYLYGNMMFNHGFIHCDPHPGNILVSVPDDTNQKGSEPYTPKIILLDHGLYSQASPDFTYHFSSLWYSLIVGNTNAIKKHAAFFNVAGACPNENQYDRKIEMHEMFGAMLMAADYDKTVKKGGGLQNEEKGHIDRDRDRKKLQSDVQEWMYDITEVLQAVPQEIVLILKTNDLMRSLEYQFNCRANLNTYVAMTEWCLKRIYTERKNAISSNFFGFYTSVYEFVRLWIMRWAIYFFQTI